MGDLKLIEGPLGQKILRELGIDRVVFDQQQFDHEAVPTPGRTRTRWSCRGVTQGSCNGQGVIRLQRQVVIVGGGCLPARGMAALVAHSILVVTELRRF